jgi:PD-(D/E)XK endonuclease
MSTRKSSTNPKPTRKPRQPKRKNTKVTGERSEAAFLNRASDQGFGVAKPWGDSLRYDFILDNGSRLLRIQVKCTESIRARAYETRATYTTGKSRAVYTTKDIDFIAAHVVPLDIWYIIPVEICTPAPMLRFYPHRQAKKMRLEPYREAWHLLQSPEETGKEETGKIEIQARADEAIYRDHDSQSTSIKIVIPSEGADPRSGSAPQSRDLGLDSPIHLPTSAAPWPIPPLKILTTRKTTQILPTPPK